MTVEITSATMDQGVIIIEAIDCRDETLQRIERYRDDYIVRELTFVFDTKNDQKAFRYFIHWLKDQRAVKGCRTYGDAFRSIIGTITDISGRYLEFAY